MRRGRSRGRGGVRRCRVRSSRGRAGCRVRFQVRSPGVSGRPGRSRRRVVGWPRWCAAASPAVSAATLPGSASDVRGGSSNRARERITIRTTELSRQLQHALARVDALDDSALSHGAPARTGPPAPNHRLPSCRTLPAFPCGPYSFDPAGVSRSGMPQHTDFQSARKQHSPP